MAGRKNFPTRIQGRQKGALERLEALIKRINTGEHTPKRFKNTDFTQEKRNSYVESLKEQVATLKERIGISSVA